LRDKNNQLIRSNHDVIKVLKDINEVLIEKQIKTNQNDRRWQA